MFLLLEGFLISDMLENMSGMLKLTTVSFPGSWAGEKAHLATLSGT